MSRTEPVTPAQACLDRLATGDPSARDDLVRATWDRLLARVRGLLTRYPGVRRWEESSDVLQNVWIRLERALAQVRPATTGEFLGLAVTNIRRELIDLARHYFGPQGVGANHATPPVPADGPEGRGRDDPITLAQWAELQEQVDRLPDDEREVVNLHSYYGMSQPEVARQLGVSLKTVVRRWTAARVRLGAVRGDDGP
jgi:RNA polymerase sigma-70 factor (ECF subfamily)